MNLLLTQSRKFMLFDKPCSYKEESRCFQAYATFWINYRNTGSIWNICSNLRFQTVCKMFNVLMDLWLHLKEWFVDFLLISFSLRLSLDVQRDSTRVNMKLHAAVAL